MTAHAAHCGLLMTSRVFIYPQLLLVTQSRSAMPDIICQRAFLNVRNARLTVSVDGLFPV